LDDKYTKNYLPTETEITADLAKLKIYSTGTVNPYDGTPANITDDNLKKNIYDLDVRTDSTALGTPGTTK